MIGFVHDNENKDWIRRRQMRLLQVRKQSSDIAKRLRDRAAHEQSQKLEEKQRELESKINIWKINRINDLERIYRDTVTDIGTGHKLAIEEVDVNKMVIEKQKLYICKAKERGVIAMENELKEKREALERKRLPIQRKVITRQIENIRSSLVRSLPKTDKKYQSTSEKPYHPTPFLNDKVQRKSNDKTLHTAKPLESECYRENADCRIPRSQKKSAKMTYEKKIKANSSISNPTRLNKEPLKEKKINLNSPKGKKTWVDLRTVEVSTNEDEDEVECLLDEDEPFRENMDIIHANKKVEDKQLANATVKETSSKESNKSVSCNVLKKKQSQKIKPKTRDNVCHAYSARYECNSKDEVFTFRKIENQSEADANELAAQEESSLEREKEIIESKRTTARERGMKAIEKEKITQSYSDLMSKLEKLTVKEKLIKSYCHIPPPHVFMSDERRKEKHSMKQRKMDSKFEQIYYDVMGFCPDADLATRLNFGSVPDDYNSQGDGDNLVTKLDFGRTLTNIKTNSPASSICESDIAAKKDGSNCNRSNSDEHARIDETISALMYKGGKIKKQKVEIDLAEIDKILEKCRELRESSRGDVRVENRLETVTQPELVEGKVKENGKTETETVQKETDQKVTEAELGKSSLPHGEKSKFSEIEKLESKKKNDSEKRMMEILGAGDLPPLFPITNNIIAWPVQEVKKKCKSKADESFGSTSTSYKSLPPIRPKNINCILMILEQLKEREGNCTVADELIINLEHLLDSMIRELEDSNANMSQEIYQEFQSNPRLQYYISKLLDMSRERIANLSVSSGSGVQSPKMGGLCAEDWESTTYYDLPSENKYLKQQNDLSLESRIRRAVELERIIKKWKSIIEQNVGKCPQNKCHKQERMDGRKTCPKQKRKCVPPTEDRYEAISKKCSDRMSILNDILGEGHQKHRNSRESDVKCSKSAVEGTGCNKCSAKRNQADLLQKTKCERSGSCKSKSHKNENMECPKSKSCKRKQMENSPPNVCPGRRQLSENGVCDDNTSTESFPDGVDELLQHDLISESIAWSRGTGSRSGSPRNCSYYTKTDSDSDIMDIDDYLGEPGYQCTGVRCPYRNDEEGLFIAQCSATCRSPCSHRLTPVMNEEPCTSKSTPCASPATTASQINDQTYIVRPGSCPSTPVTPSSDQTYTICQAPCPSKSSTPCKTNEETYTTRSGSCPSTPVSPRKMNEDPYNMRPCPYSPKSGTPHKINEETYTIRPCSRPSTPGTPQKINQQTYTLSPGTPHKLNETYTLRPGSCPSTPGTPHKINEGTYTIRPCSRPSTPGTPHKINQQTYTLSPGTPHKLNETYTLRPGPCPSTPGTPHKLNETYTVRPASCPPTPGTPFKMVDTCFVQPLSAEKPANRSQRRESSGMEGGPKTPSSQPTAEWNCSWNSPGLSNVTDPALHDMEHGIYSPIERTMSSCNATDASERNQKDFSTTKLEELMRRHAEGVHQRLYEVIDVKPEEVDFYSQMYETSRAVPCVIDGQDRWNASGIAWREGGGKRAQLQRLLNEQKAPPAELNETGYRVNFSPGHRPKTPVQPANFFPELSPIQGPYRRGAAGVCEHACEVHCTPNTSGRRPVSANASTPKKDRVDRLAQSLPNVRTSPHMERINSSRRPCPKDVTDVNEGEAWITLGDASTGEEFEIRPQYLRELEEHQQHKSPPKVKSENVQQMKFLDLMSEIEGGSCASGSGSFESE